MRVSRWQLKLHWMKNRYPLRLPQQTIQQNEIKRFYQETLVRIYLFLHSLLPPLSSVLEFGLMAGGRWKVNPWGLLDFRKLNDVRKFRGLVLGCIEVDFSKKILVGMGMENSWRDLSDLHSFVPTSPTSTIQHIFVANYCNFQDNSSSKIANSFQISYGFALKLAHTSWECHRFSQKFVQNSAENLMKILEIRKLHAKVM